jgi:hypothetical protein
LDWILALKRPPVLKIDSTTEDMPMNTSVSLARAEEVVEGGIRRQIGISTVRI